MLFFLKSGNFLFSAFFELSKNKFAYSFMNYSNYFITNYETVTYV